MTSTGITRKVDELGRVVLPIELRKQLGWEARDALNIQHDGDRIILSKANPSCIFCDSEDEAVLNKFKNKDICVNCHGEIRK